MAARKAEALRSLATFVSTRAKDGEFTLERLMDIADDHDAIEVAEVAAELVRSGQLEQFIRVESSVGNGGIDDFPSIIAVPEKIFDWRAGMTVDVTMDRLRILYRRPLAEADASGVEQK